MEEYILEYLDEYPHVLALFRSIKGIGGSISNMPEHFRKDFEQGKDLNEEVAEAMAYLMKAQMVAIANHYGKQIVAAADQQYFTEYLIKTLDAQDKANYGHP